MVGTVQVTDTQSKLSTGDYSFALPSTDLMKDDFIVRPKLTPRVMPRLKRINC